MDAAGSDVPSAITNVADYRFVDLVDLDRLQSVFRSVCLDLGLKGTVLLAPEGLNFFVAGPVSSIDGFVEFLERDERFAGIDLKRSLTDYQPFNRLNIRKRKRSFPSDWTTFDGRRYRRPHFTAGVQSHARQREFVHVLDTRNDYEMRIGTFENAISLDLHTFRDFPEAVANLPCSMKDEPVVMFCTGGIRCEKASAIMMEAGFTNVKQLHGGVLGYFEAVGGAHWNGDCFVFDQRVAVDSSLKETDVVVCFACREPLTVEEQRSPDYAVGVSCPYCIERGPTVPLIDE